MTALPEPLQLAIAVDRCFEANEPFILNDPELLGERAALQRRIANLLEIGKPHHAEAACYARVRRSLERSFIFITGQLETWIETDRIDDVPEYLTILPSTILRLSDVALLERCEEAHRLIHEREMILTPSGMTSHDERAFGELQTALALHTRELRTGLRGGAALEARKKELLDEIQNQVAKTFPPLVEAYERTAPRFVLDYRQSCRSPEADRHMGTLSSGKSEGAPVTLLS